VSQSRSAAADKPKLSLTIIQKAPSITVSESNIICPIIIDAKVHLTDMPLDESIRQVLSHDHFSASRQIAELMMNRLSEVI
jgi:hypothetical protein